MKFVTESLYSEGSMGEYHYGDNRGPNSLKKNIPYPPRDEDDYEYDDPGNPGFTGSSPSQGNQGNQNINHNNLLVPGYNPGSDYIGGIS